MCEKMTGVPAVLLVVVGESVRWEIRIGENVCDNILTPQVAELIRELSSRLAKFNIKSVRKLVSRSATVQLAVLVSGCAC